MSKKADKLWQYRQDSYHSVHTKYYTFQVSELSTYGNSFWHLYAHEKWFIMKYLV